MSIEPRALLRALFEAAIAAADPARCLPAHLPPPPAGRTVVVGAGKAAAAMARAVEMHWPGPLGGLVVTRYGHGVPCRRIEVVEAAHPVPDAAGREAARRILELARGLGPDDLLLCLISGGGSALLTLPAEPLELADKQAIGQALLRCGATIGEINTVRKHLSAIKGGRLALAAAPARCVTLAISDVPGDDPAVIASGPTVGDASRGADARAVLARHGIAVSARIGAFLDSPAAETPAPDDPRLAHCAFRLIARPRQSLRAAADLALSRGIEPELLGDAIEGEARDVAREHGARILARDPPCLLLSGGETTVTIRGRGRGGPNTEYLLALAIALDGAAGIHAIACDSDGIDGSEDNAGAIIGPDTLARARGAGLDPNAHLDDNDAYGFFAGLGDLIVTGPTRTNVNDVRAILRV